MTHEMDTANDGRRSLSCRQTNRHTIHAATTLALLLATLTPLPAAAQNEPSAKDYGQLAGCSEEPARFFSCAREKLKAGSISIPRTADGKPDFGGMWGRAGVSSHNIEAHAASFGDPGGASLIVDPADGRIPYHAWAIQQRDRNPDTYMDPQAMCAPPGPGRFAYVPGGYQILQTPTSLVFLYEHSHAYRVIPTDGRPHLGQALSLTTGHAVGRWEGDTFVVDVTNLRGTTWFDDAGNFYTGALHVVERWTMIDANAMLYEATFDDPAVYTRPWTIALGIRRNMERGYELLESACHEGNRSSEGMIRIGLKPFLGLERPQ